MTKDELMRVVDCNTETFDNYNAIMTAVEAYSSASNNGKPIVSGSLPLSDADKLDIAWRSLQWVGFKRGEEFSDDDVLRMLGQ
jgi:hypothetical protein